MNDHWLKDRYKDITTDELIIVLNNRLMFDPFNTEYKTIQDELKRREQVALIQEDTPNN